MPYRKDDLNELARYLSNSNDYPKTTVQSLENDGDSLKIRLLHDGNMAVRGVLNSVKKEIPHYFLDIIRKGPTGEVRGIIECSENTDYILFSFDEEWFTELDPANGANQAELKERIMSEVTHGYGDSPEI